MFCDWTFSESDAKRCLGEGGTEKAEIHYTDVERCLKLIRIGGAMGVSHVNAL